MIEDFKCLQVNHDNQRIVPLVGHEKPLTGDGNSFERSIAVGAEVFLYRRPVDVESLNLLVGGVAAENPAIRLFANVKAP